MVPSKFRFIFQLTLIVPFICATNAFSQLNIKAYIADARKDMSDKNYFDAIQKLDVCVEVNPSEYVAYFYRGVCKYYLKDDLGAEQDLNSCMSAYNPMLYDAYHYRSLVKYRLGDYEGAVKDIDHVINGLGNEPELLVERAFYKLSAQDFKGAISDCNNALHAHYAGENVYLCKGMAENALTKYDSALTNYAIALKLNPKDEEVHIRIGMTDAILEKYKEAIEQYSQALKIDSTSTLAYYNRAEANLKLNNDKEAMEDFNRVINYDPQNALAYFNKAVLEANKNDYTDAIADFDKVLTLNPKNIQALLNRAKLETQTKDYSDALADYNATIGYFPYFVEAYYERGHLKEILKDDNGAKADYKLGKVMGELSRYGDTVQRTRDSITLTHLLALNSNFNNGDQKLPDTTHIDLIPLYHIALKDNSAGSEKSGCIPLFFKRSKKEYIRFCLTNKEITTGNTSQEGSQTGLNETTKENDGQDTETLLEKAVQETNMQLFNAAGKDYTEIIAQDTGSAIAYFARGIDICRETEALGQLNDDGQDTYINKTYRVVHNPANDNYEKAVADFSKVIQIEPDFAYAYYNRAYIKYKLHDLDGAVEDYNAALKIDPDFADAYYNRGILLFLQSDKIDACEDFSKAGELGLTEAYLIIKIYCSQVTK